MEIVYLVGIIIIIIIFVIIVVAAAAVVLTLSGTCAIEPAVNEHLMN